MKNLKEADFAERRKTALAAKLQLLEKHRQAPKPDDPEVIARRAERLALAESREARRREREQAKREQAEREALEAAERAAAAEAQAREDAIAHEARLVAEAAERKAERDRRYAARKARQR